MEAKGIEALKARFAGIEVKANPKTICLLYTSPSPRDRG